MALADLLRRVRVPHVFTLLLAVVALTSALSWVVPSGSFERVETTVGTLTRTLVQPGTYTSLDKHITASGVLFTPESVPESAAAPVSLQQFLTAIPRGLEDSADIVFFIFIVGGVFGILQATGTILATLGRMVSLFHNKPAVLVVVLVFLMGVGGSTAGMGEEFIPLAPIFVALSLRLGYDRVYGLAIVILSAGIGFAAATTNPFTVGIAQGIAGLPIGSGIAPRVVFFFVCMALTVVHILRYGARIRTDPTRSVVYGLPSTFQGDEHAELPALSIRHVLILAMALGLFGLLITGTLRWGWYLNELAGGFFFIGLLAAAIAGLSPRVATDAFVRGMHEMVVAALVVGFARAILMVMQDAQILDTLIAGAASLLNGSSPHIAAQGMLIFQTLLNTFVPSGSGQAAVTMPLMAPLADLTGITRQTAVLAFQCGDGFSNMVIPTSGSLMAMLLMGDVPYDRWVRFAAPLVLQLLAMSSIFLAWAVATGWG